MITQDDVKKVFLYKDGSLIRRSNNKVAGSVNSRGYLNVGFKNRIYVAHRLIFIYHHGHLPDFIDHIDGDRLNNKIENLRQATKSKNSQNMKMSKNNTSGVKGVHWCKIKCRWVAKITKEGEVAYSGLFKSLKDAELAVKENRKFIHKEFCRDE